MNIIRTNTEVEVVLSRSQGRDGGKSWALRVTDRRSRAQIIRLEMDNDTFADMMSSSITGNHADAEVALVPWIGKYLQTETRSVPAKGYGPELDREMEMAASKVLENDPDLNRNQGWQYAGYSGGGGGSPNRTLRFVRYLDHDPEES